jgi:DNA-binding MarR family transcriptional regulator
VDPAREASHDVRVSTPADDSSPGSRLGPVLGFMRALWEVDHALLSASKRMRARLGVSGPERLVLRIVGEMPGITPGALADTMHLDPSTLTGLLQRLVRRKLLSRSADPHDARKSHLRLTAGGRAIDEVRSGTIEAGVRTALEALTPRDVAATAAVLGTVSRVLNGMTFDVARTPRAPLVPGIRPGSRRGKRS